MNSELKDKRNRIYKFVFFIMLVLFIIFINFIDNSNIIDNNVDKNTNNEIVANENINTIKDIDEIPEYSGELVIIVNNNIPFFTESDLTEESFIKFSNLDEKGRCGVAIANISKDMLPEENVKRDDLKKIIPTGWSDIEYEKVISGKKLYNKSHLLAFSLIGRCNENINKNIITGTHT